MNIKDDVEQFHSNGNTLEPLRTPWVWVICTAIYMDGLDTGTEIMSSEDS